MFNFINLLIGLIIILIITGLLFFIYRNNQKKKSILKKEEKENTVYNEEIIKLYTHLANNASLYNFYYNFYADQLLGKDCFLIIKDPNKDIVYKLYIGYTDKNNTKLKLYNCFSKLIIDKLDINISNIKISEELYNKLYEAFIYPLTTEYKLKKLNTDLLIGIKND